MSLYRTFFSLILGCAALGCGDDTGSGGQGGAGDGGSSDGGGASVGGGGQGGDAQGGDGPGGDGPGGQGHGGDGGGAECARPVGGVWATFDVVGQVYRAHITNTTGVQQALDLWSGTSNATIPNGSLVCASASFNCGHSFHQDPATIEFAEITIEVCDGTPSYVDENCADFGGQYCPWTAELIELRDCRTDPACPIVP